MSLSEVHAKTAGLPAGPRLAPYKLSLDASITLDHLCHRAGQEIAAFRTTAASDDVQQVIRPPGSIRSPARARHPLISTVMGALR